MRSLFKALGYFILSFLPLILTGSMVIGLVWGACYVLDSYGR